MNSESLAIVGIMGFVWLALWAAISLLPYYTRKSISFGVAVPPDQKDEPFLAGLRKHYVVVTTLIAVVLGSASLLSVIRMSEHNAVAQVASLAILVYLALTFVMFARCNRLVLAYKNNSDWVIQSLASGQCPSQQQAQQSSQGLATSDASDKRKLFSPLWCLIYLLPIAATTAYSFAIYPSLPNKLPMNMDFAGNVHTWATKSHWTILQMPLIMLALAILYLGLALMINSAKRPVDGTGSARDLVNNRNFQIIMGRSMFVMGLLLQFVLATAQLSMLKVLPMKAVLWIIMGLLAVIAIGVIVITVKVGQGGYRLSADAPTAASGGLPVAGDDSHWVFFGTFYNNPDDPTLFPQRRVGLGWTLNIGLPAGKAILAIFALLIVGLIVIRFIAL